MNKKRLVLGIVLGLATVLLKAQTPMESVILGGELSNSAATSVADIDEVMPRMAALGLNTVLVPAAWEFVEPEEGRFDFELVDRVVQKARENQLHVVFLWFGAWKNSMSCYAPLWFKKDTKRFPRARTAQGKPLEIATPFSENVLRADLRAFTKLMEHLAAIDKGTGTVVMMQIENEIGMLESARDHSPQAEAVYRQGVPKELAAFLEKEKLHPWLAARFNAKGNTWTEVFGDDIYTDEIFMAYYYAKYVEALAQAARKTYDMPLYVNAAMNSRGRKPGEYPSAGPLAHLIDLWHAGAPSIDLLAPDIYDTGFKGWAAQYALHNNRLFIPESRCCENSGVRALYAFGEYRALGFSPFAIDQAGSKETESVTKAYGLMRQVANLPAYRKADGTVWGLLFDQQDKERVVSDGGTVMTARHYFTLPWDARATDGNVWPEGGALLVKLDKNEYLLAGSGVVVEFKTQSEKAQEEKKVLGEDGFVDNGASGNNAPSVLPKWKGSRLGIGSVDEVTIDENGHFGYLRRHNGDQDHQGRHVRIGVGEWKILHVRLYEYE